MNKDGTEAVVLRVRQMIMNSPPVSCQARKSPKHWTALLLLWATRACALFKFYVSIIPVKHLLFILKGSRKFLTTCVVMKPSRRSDYFFRTS